MTVASPLHVRIPVRRKPKHRGIYKAAGFGLAAALLVPLTLGMTLIGVSRMRPASMEMRADVRFTGTYGPASGRLVWSTLSNDVMQSPFYLAEAETSAAPVVALVSLPENAERLDEPKFTGSLGPKIVTPERFLRPAANPRLDADRPQPRARESVKESVKGIAREIAKEITKPQPKQKLAALSPAEIGIKPPQQEEAPPKTAYYDITAKIVYMPNGERLEAHSGLGRYMDDPSHFKLKMRGVTPPNTYRLRERERLFHGVRAILLIPEDEKAMFGRDGILAHTYMLGSSGQSNGCVSLKYYDKFLQAFLRGEVERLVVVVKMDKPPVFARRTMKSAQNTNQNTN
jgi:hypothetical protein